MPIPLAAPRRTRTLIVLLAAVVAVSVAAYLIFFRRDLTTRIATRQLNAAATTAPAVEDWPNYRGPRFDGVSRERDLVSAIAAEGLRQLWSADVGHGYSSPVAADDRVYLFTLNSSKEALTGFDASSGRIIWSHEEPTGWARSYPGTRATPSIDLAGSSIYTYGGAGDLLRRDLKSGEVRWRLNVLKATNTTNHQWGCASSPLVAARFVYVQAGAGGPVAVAVDKETGAIAWQSEFRGSGSYAQPLLINVGGTAQLIIFCADGVVAMTPDAGRTLWHVPWKTSYDVHAATPVYSEPHLLISSAYNQGGMMLRVSAASAEKLWESKEIACKVNAPVLDPADGHLYVNSVGTVKCVSWPDGAVKWSARESALRLGEGGSLVRAGDSLLALSERGKLSLMRATPQGYRVMGQAAAVEGTTVFSTPLLYGRRLYAKGTTEFICFDLGT